MGMSMLSPAAAAQGPGGLSTGDDSGATLTTGDDSGSAPAAGDDSGSAPATGDEGGTTPAAGDDSGAARPMFRAPTVRLTNSEEHYWDALDLEDGMYLPYTGSPIEPEISSEELVEGKDYTVSYKDAKHEPLSGAPTDVGEYYVVLTGIDTYDGKTKELRFVIYDWRDLSNASEVLIVPGGFSYTASLCSLSSAASGWIRQLAPSGWKKIKISPSALPQPMAPR